MSSKSGRKRRAREQDTKPRALPSADAAAAPQKSAPPPLPAPELALVSPPTRDRPIEPVLVHAPVAAPPPASAARMIAAAPPSPPPLAAAETEPSLSAVEVAVPHGVLMVREAWGRVFTALDARFDHLEALLLSRFDSASATAPSDRPTQTWISRFLTGDSRLAAAPLAIRRAARQRRLVLAMVLVFAPVLLVTWLSWRSALP